MRADEIAELRAWVQGNPLIRNDAKQDFVFYAEDIR
jgi:hypothetical protein